MMGFKRYESGRDALPIERQPWGDWVPASAPGTLNVQSRPTVDEVSDYFWRQEHHEAEMAITDAFVTAAGFNPDDEGVWIIRLAEEWNGHPAGSLVVTTLDEDENPTGAFAVLMDG